MGDSIILDIDPTGPGSVRKDLLESDRMLIELSRIEARDDNSLLELPRRSVLDRLHLTARLDAYWARMSARNASDK